MVLDKAFKKKFKLFTKKFIKNMKKRKYTADDVIHIGWGMSLFGVVGMTSAVWGDNFLNSLKIFGVMFLLGIIIFSIGYRISTHVKVPKHRILNYAKSPDYCGENKVPINGGKSGFDTDEVQAILKNLKGKTYGFKKPLLHKRPSTATAVLTPKQYNESPRGSLNVNPAGFRNVKLQDNTWLYNRSHLIAFSFLKADVDVIENLITGTRDFNADRSWGMLAVEDTLREYLSSNGKKYHPRNEIIYQISPVYRGLELVPRGVHIRAKSLVGYQLDLNVFIHNVQDGIAINYNNGEHKLIS